MTFKHRIYGKPKALTIEALIDKFSNKKLDYIKLALLFGSRASNTHTSKSDYDIAIITDTLPDEAWGTISRAWNDIGEELELPEYDYDIVDLHNANKTMLDSIEENYIVLKGDESEFPGLFK